MARKHTRGIGSVVTIRRMRGLGRLKNPSSFMGAALPPLVGGLVTGLTVLATRYWAKPSEGDTPRALYRWAPLLGLGAGSIASIALYWLGGAPASVASLATSLGAGGSLMLLDMVQKNSLGEYALALPADVTAPPADQAASGAAATAGLRGRMGVVVPQRLSGGTKGIVMENPASRNPYQRYGVQGVGAPYGEDVNLGSINPGAFGTPGFGNR